MSSLKMNQIKLKSLKNFICLASDLNECDWEYSTKYHDNFVFISHIVRSHSTNICKYPAVSCSGPRLSLVTLFVVSLEFLFWMSHSRSLHPFCPFHCLFIWLFYTNLPTTTNNFFVSNFSSLKQLHENGIRKFINYLDLCANTSTLR